MDINTLMDAVDRYEDSTDRHRGRWSKRIVIDMNVDHLRSAVTHYKDHGDLGIYKPSVDALLSGLPIERHHIPGLATGPIARGIDYVLMGCADILQWLLRPISFATDSMLRWFNQKNRTSSIVLAEHFETAENGQYTISVNKTLPAISDRQYIYLTYPSREFPRTRPDPKVTLVLADGEERRLEPVMWGYRIIGYRPDCTDSSLEVDSILIETEPGHTLSVHWSDQRLPKG